MERLSFKEFKDEFIIRLALATLGDTSLAIDPGALEPMIEGTYQKSWLRTAEKYLRNEGLIDGPQYLGGSQVSLTGSGISKAEDVASSYGADLYELIEEMSSIRVSDSENNVFVTESGDVLTASGDVNSNDSNVESIIKIDHTSQAFKELQRHMDQAVSDLKSSNSVISNGEEEANQRIFELSAGIEIIKADRADRNLIRRLLIKPLQYFSRLVTDQSLRTLIEKIIERLILIAGGAAL